MGTGQTDLGDAERGRSSLSVRATDAVGNAQLSTQPWNYREMGGTPIPITRGGSALAHGEVRRRVLDSLHGRRGRPGPALTPTLPSTTPSSPTWPWGTRHQPRWSTETWCDRTSRQQRFCPTDVVLFARAPGEATGVSVAEAVRESVDLFLGHSGQWTKGSQVHGVSGCQAGTVSHERTLLLLLMTACANPFAIQRLSRYSRPV